MKIVFIASGKGTHHCLHGAQRVGAGDVFILRPGAWHAYEDCRKLEISIALLETSCWDAI